MKYVDHSARALAARDAIRIIDLGAASRATRARAVRPPADSFLVPMLT